MIYDILCASILFLGLFTFPCHSTSYSLISRPSLISSLVPFLPLTGTEKVVVAVHLAYAFAQKNKQMGVRKATGTKQHCVLLCAPDDTALDSTLCELVCRLCEVWGGCVPVGVGECASVLACLWELLYFSCLHCASTLMQLS